MAQAAAGALVGAGGGIAINWAFVGSVALQAIGAFAMAAFLVVVIVIAVLLLKYALERLCWDRGQSFIECVGTGVAWGQAQAEGFWSSLSTGAAASVDAIGRALPNTPGLPPGWDVIEGGKRRGDSNPAPRPPGKPEWPFPPSNPFPNPEPDPNDPDQDASCRRALSNIGPAEIMLGAEHASRYHDGSVSNKGVFKEPDPYSIMGLIEQAVEAPDPLYPREMPPDFDGATCKLRHTFWTYIGRSREGRPSKVIEVNYDLSGTVHSAYPV